MPWSINEAVDVVKWIITAHGGNDDAQAFRQICTYILEAEKSVHNSDYTAELREGLMKFLEDESPVLFEDVNFSQLAIRLNASLQKKNIM